MTQTHATEPDSVPPAAAKKKRQRWPWVLATVVVVVVILFVLAGIGRAKHQVVLAPQDLSRSLAISQERGAVVATGTAIPAAAPAPAIRIPDVTGASRQSALERLSQLGFKTILAETTNPTIATDTVIAQMPPAGVVATQGAGVGILISLGSPPDAAGPVPSIEGMTLADARKELTKAGLKITVVPDKHDSAQASDIVTDQRPQTAEMARKGSSVLVFVARPAQ